MFGSDTSLRELVHKWSECSLPGAEFTHSAHVAVGSYLAWNNTLAKSYVLMKTGLCRFNEATGTPNSDERGYHETLTRFWCTVLFYKIHQGHYNRCLDAVNAMVKQLGKDNRADRAYYSFDVLKSKQARRTWVAPDLDSEIPREAFHW